MLQIFISIWLQLYENMFLCMGSKVNVNANVKYFYVFQNFTFYFFCLHLNYLIKFHWKLTQRQEIAEKNKISLLSFQTLL